MMDLYFAENMNVAVVENDVMFAFLHSPSLSRSLKSHPEIKKERDRRI